MLEGGTVTSTGVPASPTEAHFLDGGNDPLLPTSISMSLKREDGVVKEEGEGSVATIAGSADGVVKANKGMILRKSVEYIR